MEIMLNNVSKTLKSTTVISDVNMHLRSGKVYGFQGINGSGKTMLMRLISGLIHPTCGEVIADGKLLKGINTFPNNMGILIENPTFLNRYSGFENLRMLTKISNTIGDDEIRYTLSRVGLEPTDKKKYRKYSLGMKQRLGIACAIMERPDLLILDEPLNSLDEDGIRLVLRIIKEEKDRGVLVIIACHDYETLSEVSDELFRIVAGKITKHLVKVCNGNYEEAID
jgi:ABC-2 type transport system ATP-binding protein